MSWIPEEFKNKPSKETPLNADNLNHINQGVLLAVDRSRHADEIATNLNRVYEDGELNGKDGDIGPRGPAGPIGPAGLNWKGEYSDVVEYVKDDAVAFDGATYFSLKPSTGIAPLPENDSWALMAAHGLKGDKGDKGESGTLDLSALSQAQLKELSEKLYKFNDVYRWYYKTSIATGKTSRMPIGDLNLYLDFTNYGASMMTYKVTPINPQQPATYYIKRLANYDLVAFEGTASAGYTPKAVPASGFVLDTSAYYAGREDIIIEIYDQFADKWYTVHVFGNGTDEVLLVDVVRRAAQGRTHISPV